jgi:hypothetical protein
MVLVNFPARLVTRVMVPFAGNLAQLAKLTAVPSAQTLQMAALTKSRKELSKLMPSPSSLPTSSLAETLKSSRSLKALMISQLTSPTAFAPSPRSQSSSFPPEIS